MNNPWVARPVRRPDSAVPGDSVGSGGQHGTARTSPSSNTDEPVFRPERALRTLADVVVPDSVMHHLEVAMNLVEHHQHLFEVWNLRKLDPHRLGTALNFYGPPGTGKSLCAEGLASRFDRPFIQVNYAEIESKYVGETPKNIVRLFEAARRHDAILVFEEADSILGSRLSDVRASADHSVNLSRSVMLTQLDRFAGLVVFTTNFPENYDPAFVRRILVNVRFELPDAPTRRRLWELLLPVQLPRSTDVDLATLAEETEGLSGGDISNVIIGAASTAVGRSPDARRVQMDDLRVEIGRIRNAQAEVGRSRWSAPAVVRERAIRLVEPQETQTPGEPSDESTRGS
jgi:SpoVK/Ycf46/Vps4 family AAA+-type ATPase